MKRCANCKGPISIRDTWCPACNEPVAQSRTKVEVQWVYFDEARRAIQAAADLGDIPQAAWDAHKRIERAIESTEAKIRREE